MRTACGKFTTLALAYMHVCDRQSEAHRRPCWCSSTRRHIVSCMHSLDLWSLGGKRLGELTVIPWREGRSVTWDVTVTNTVAASYWPSSSTTAAAAAESAAERKVPKYSELSKNPLLFLLPSKPWAQSVEQDNSSSQTLAIGFLPPPTILTNPFLFRFPKSQSRNLGLWTVRKPKYFGCWNSTPEGAGELTTLHISLTVGQFHRYNYY